MTVTIRDVAKRACVSISTVSRAMNNPESLKGETAARVLEAVAALGYRPNKLGRGLKAQRSQTLGILVPSLSNQVFAQAVSGVQEVARPRGYGLLVAASDYEPLQEREAVETMLASRVDGLILTLNDADDPGIARLMTLYGVPGVLVYNQPSATRGLPTITVDNLHAGMTAARSLHEKGHRKLGVVAGALDRSDRARVRVEGFLAACRELGLARPLVLELPFQERDLVPYLSRALATTATPDAVFCTNDLIALRSIAALHSLGLRVPEDVSVLGFDGIEVGRLTLPSLASIEQPSEEMGRSAAEQIFTLLEGGEARALTVLPHRLVPGASLAPRQSLEERHGAAPRIPVTKE